MPSSQMYVALRIVLELKVTQGWIVTTLYVFFPPQYVNVNLYRCDNVSVIRCSDSRSRVIPTVVCVSTSRAFPRNTTDRTVARILSIVLTFISHRKRYRSYTRVLIIDTFDFRILHVMDFVSLRPMFVLSLQEKRETVTRV